MLRYVLNVSNMFFRRHLKNIIIKYWERIPLLLNCELIARWMDILDNFPRLSGQTWWRHQMETFSALLAICAVNSPVPGEFPAQRPVTRSFDVFFNLRQNKQLSKQSWGWWFETSSCPLWRHCNDLLYISRYRKRCSCWVPSNTVYWDIYRLSDDQNRVPFL